MKKIPLTQGKFAIVDDSDYEELSQYHWWAVKQSRALFYVVREPRHKGVRKMIIMHRVVMRAGPEEHVDHINGNGLDNRRSNLRVVSREQNQRNRNRKKPNATSKYRGVSLHKRTGLWIVQLRWKGHESVTKYFRDEKQAARFYDAEGLARDPEHFNPNFPESRCR